MEFGQRLLNVLLLVSAVGSTLADQTGFIRPADPADSFPCESERAWQYMRHGVPRIELTAEDKRHLLQLFGHSVFIPSLLASSPVSPVRSSSTGDTSRSHVVGLKRNHRRSTEDSDQFKSPSLTSDDTDHEIEYCERRDSPYPVLNASEIDADTSMYRRMCTVCQITSPICEDMYPDMFNEVVCDSTELGCLYENKDAKEGHGRCQQIHAWVEVLKKSADNCLLYFKDDQAVLAEEWTLDAHLIGVGCECAILRDSAFK